MKKEDKKTKNYAEQYRELLRQKGVLWIHEPPAAKLKKIYTYQDYINWPENERIELIDGQIYAMAAPSKMHQRILGLLFQRFSIYLHRGKCEVFVAPIDVRIDFSIGEDSVVQPDLIVVCNEEMIDAHGVNGAPEFIIEILSPTNRYNDKFIKYNKYLLSGVPEYWIIDPVAREIAVHLLSENKKTYITKTYKKGDVIKVHILDNLHINVTDLFEGYQGKEIVEVEDARKEIAKNLFNTTMSNEEISAATGLSINEVTDLSVDH